MAYRKLTIRQIPGPESRKLARLVNDLDSTLTKLKNLMPQIQSIEMDSIALYWRLSTYEKKVFQEEKANQPAEQLPIMAPDPTAICQDCEKACKGEQVEPDGSCTQYQGAEKIE